MDGKLNKGKSSFIEIFSIAIIVIAFTGLGIVILGNYANSYMEDQPSAGTVRELVARVKGSIYESGEAMSVFGTCVDAYDVAVVNSTATFSAWYPNGTQFINGTSMTQIAEGYFLYEGTMSVVQGTYLTEMTCHAFLSGWNQTAKAWGEWQNPFWVERIGNLSDQIEQGFNNTIQNITFLQENMTNNFNYTNQLILDTQVIANASVDRNNSLLAQLLYYLVNVTEQCCLQGNVTWDEDYGRIIYGRYWNINVNVYDAEDGSRLTSPEVACTINTTLHDLRYMDVEGNHFSSSLYIFQGGDFSWTTNCFYT